MSAPKARPGFYVYAVVDLATEPATLIAVELTRKDARSHCHNMLGWDTAEVPKLCVRRARLQTYET